MQNTTTNNQETLSAAISKFIDICKAHKKPLLVILIAVVVLAGGISGYVSHRKNTLQNSWARFYDAQLALLSQGQEAGFAAFDQLNEAYPDTDAAYYGKLMQADLLFTEENFAQAEDIYKTLLNAKNPQVRAIAAVSLGGAQQAVQDYKESISTLQNFITANPTSFALPQAYFTLALSQELSGDTAAALDTYKKLLEDYTQTYFGVFAKDKINQLSK